MSTKQSRQGNVGIKTVALKKERVSALVAVRWGLLVISPAQAEPNDLPRTTGPETAHGDDQNIKYPWTVSSLEEKEAHEVHHLPCRAWSPE